MDKKCATCEKRHTENSEGACYPDMYTYCVRHDYSFYEEESLEDLKTKCNNYAHALHSIAVNLIQTTFSKTPELHRLRALEFIPCEVLDMSHYEGYIKELANKEAQNVSKKLHQITKNCSTENSITFD